MFTWILNLIDLYRTWQYERGRFLVVLKTHGRYSFSKDHLWIEKGKSGWLVQVER